MSVTGLCQVCQSAQATERCGRCGTLVCREHFDTDLGYCVECSRSLRRDRGGGGYQI